MDFFSDLPRMLLAAAGIGLVIFVHELGHFLAARWCGVRVDVFSLGFGPRVISWVRGPTRYQLALVPLGGYVRMAGEEGRPVGTPSAPDHLWAKPVGQRFFIYSGGVLMNMLFGLVVFPILFARGVPFTEPVIGDVVPGGPAWQARLEPGTRVLEVNHQNVIEYGHFYTQVALGDPQSTTLLVQAPGDARAREVELQPRFDAQLHIYTLEVDPPFDADGRVAVARGGAAELAGLRDGDQLLGIDGAPSEFTLSDQYIWATVRQGPIALRVRAADAGVSAPERRVEIAPQLLPAIGKPRLGISPLRNHVIALRANPDLDTVGLRVDDRLLALDGAPIHVEYDLERQLLDHAERGTLAREQPLVLRVRRDGRELELALPALDRARALRLASDIALRSDVQSTEVSLAPGGAAARAGLRDGDRILALDDTAVTTWKALQDLIERAGAEGRAVALRVERPIAHEAPAQLELVVDPRPTEPPSYGFTLLPRRYVYRSASLPEAFRAGVVCSWRFVEDSWLTIKRMLLGQVGSQNIGGIISIGHASYSWAQEGVAKLFYFLALLSINLAFVNILPIPLLDGGHLSFLLIEKLKGSPVSERVYGYSQMVGLVLILSLMVYVTYNDILRLFR